MTRFVLIAALFATVGGCAFLNERNYKNASVVDYLYPDKNAPRIEVTVPKLKIPARVGIAFVPSGISRSVTEPKQQEILNEVAEHFREYKFVDHIEVIPAAYLSRGGGFENLDQLRRMFNIDLVALVSYDQNQFTDEGFASLAYWTVVGAYIVRGEKNSTHTLMDTVVYDIESRSLLFRAPGVSQVKSKSTLVNLSEQQRLDSEEGFSLAGVDMITNLDAKLVQFKERIKQQPEKVQVEYREGYGGGGSFGLWGVLFVLTVLIGRLRCMSVSSGFLEKQ